MGMRRVGTAFFAVGLVLAVLIGVVFSGLMNAWEEIAVIAVLWLLIVFGLVAGFLNTAKEDAEDILYTVAVLLLASLAVGELARVMPSGFGNFIVGAAKGVIAFIFPAAVVVGAKRIWD